MTTAAVLWLLTGGLVIVNYQTYGGQSSIRTGDGLPLTLWVDTHFREIGIPFLFLYCGDQSPYSVRLSAYDHDQKVYRKFLIDEALVEYDDGQVVRLVSAVALEDEAERLDSVGAADTGRRLRGIALRSCKREPPRGKPAASNSKNHYISFSTSQPNNRVWC